MKWFGKAWGAPYEADTPRVPVPVGELCARCDEPIEPGDDGVVVPHLDGEWSLKPLHYECHLRGIIGGLNHLLGVCTCCGGSAPPDPPELTKRDAAIAAAVHWERQRQW
jgi:hypothetical protein